MVSLGCFKKEIKVSWANRIFIFQAYFHLQLPAMAREWWPPISAECSWPDDREQHRLWVPMRCLLATSFLVYSQWSAKKKAEKKVESNVKIFLQCFFINASTNRSQLFDQFFLFFVTVKFPAHREAHFLWRNISIPGNSSVNHKQKQKNALISLFNNARHKAIGK